MKVSLLPFLLLSTALCGCNLGEKNEQKDEIQKMEIQDLKVEKISSVFHALDTIFLETSDESLVAYINHLEHTGELLFISDFNNVYQFQKDGKFIRKIGRKGQGPGEYLRVKSMTISKSKKQVAVVSNNKIILYDFEGDFIREKKIPLADYITNIDDEFHIIKTEFGLPTDTKQKTVNKTYLIELDSNLNLTDSLTLRAIEVEGIKAATMRSDMQFVSRADDNYFIYYPVVYKDEITRDTLYQLLNGDLKAIEKFDFIFSDNTVDKVLIYTLEKTQNVTLGKYAYRSSENQFMLNRDGSVQLNSTEGFEDDIFGTGQAFLKVWNSKKDQFYFSKDSYEIAEYFPRVSKDDNPVVFIVQYDQN